MRRSFVPSERCSQDTRSRPSASTLATLRLRLLPVLAVWSETLIAGRSTVSGWVSEADGVIPARGTVGRCKAIVPEVRTVCA